jgi:D-alanyl-D-alanine carboxypeptidase/D-alanyl-D-alanine-endopeptidase (penicillin-binding protein 4)
MKQYARLQLTFISFVFLVLPVFAADPVKTLRADLKRIFADGRLADAQLGVKIFSLDRSEVLYETNSSKLYMPASNNKILTAAVALVRLGPDYSFKTHILADGSVVDGTLTGNLIIAGFGDPFSSSRFETKDPFRAFRDWAAKLKQRGIRTLTGSILGDGSAFEETAYGRGWAWDDLHEGFAAPVSALQFNENLVWLEITPGLKAGSLASIKMEPLAAYFTLESKVVTGSGKEPARVEVFRNPLNELVVVSGTMPLGSSAISRAVAVQYPIRYYLSALKQILNEEGIDVSNCELSETKGARPQASSLLWVHSSPPLSELIVPAMKLSLNLSNETLVRTLGLEFRGEGTFARGKEVVEETLGQMGVSKDSYSYADGSGLSRLNLVSADALVRTLRYMHQNQYFRYFYDALPIAGVDGTLATRMKRTKAQNNVHAKTGTFANASALSGYVQTADGEMLAFSILANNYVASKDAAESVQDKALARLAVFSRKGKTNTKPAAARQTLVYIP